MSSKKTKTSAGRPLALDPELAAISVLIPHFDFDDLAGARQLEQKLARQGRRRDPGVTTRDVTIESRVGEDLRLRVYRPISPVPHLPGLIYLHGGGFALGSLDTEDDRCELYARLASCVVIAVDYRLAPEHPFPAAFEDCVDALRWAHSHAQELDLDPRRLAVGGNSAGGTLAAAIALESRTPDVPSLVHQLLINPVLDHRSRTESMQRFTSTPVLTRDQNLMFWKWYLGDVTDIDHRASPTLATDVAGLPSTSVWIAEFDPLRDEAYQYVARLLDAGVSVGVTQYPGTFHGFDSYRMTTVGQRALHDQVAALRRAFQTRTPIGWQ